MPAPNNPGVDPYTHYLATRILPNGNEQVLDSFEVTSWDDQEQVIRQVTFDYARLQRINNPAWRIVIYGPIDPPATAYTDDDRIWGSWLQE